LNDKKVLKFLKFFGKGDSAYYFLRSSSYLSLAKPDILFGGSKMEKICDVIFATFSVT